MSIIDKILQFEESPTSLRTILASYLDVDQDFIMNYLTEYEIDLVETWADCNNLIISDMLDAIQRNLDSNVKLTIKNDKSSNDRSIISSELTFNDGARTKDRPQPYGCCHGQSRKICRRKRSAGNNP